MTVAVPTSSFGGGLIVMMVESAALELPRPPPDTNAEFTCGEVAVAATFTVTVIAG